MTRLEFLFANLKEGIILDVGNLGMNALIHTQLMTRYPRSVVHGVDTEAQEKYGLAFPHQKKGSVEQLPYDNLIFDTVYLGEVLEHTWVPRLVMDECHRVLKPGGVLILDTPNVYALSRMIRYCVTGRDVILGNPDHKIFFSCAMLENLFEKTGFHDIEVLSDSKCTVKGKDYPLPVGGPFRVLGEHMLARGVKV